MTDQDSPRQRSASIRVSRHERRRNRRRKSKYARPVVSLAHGLMLVFLLLLAGFLAAALNRLMGGVDLSLQGSGPTPLSDLNLPGGTSEPAAAASNWEQMLFSLYLFGSPLLFILHRAMFWGATARGAKLVIYACMIIWAIVATVITGLIMLG